MLHKKDKKIIKIVADVGEKWKSTVTPLQLLAVLSSSSCWLLRVNIWSSPKTLQWLYLCE